MKIRKKLRDLSIEELEQYCKDTMYKNMVINTGYTLGELGL